MLLEFQCSNYKSIKNPINFSLLASKDTTHKTLLKTYKNHKILRSAVIYGANGSGKSNFLSAIQNMKFLVTNSLTFEPNLTLPYHFHKLNSNLIPTEYTIQFIKENIRYAYGFSFNKEEILEEYLYSFPNERKTKIFEREHLNISINNQYKKNIEVSQRDILKPNRLFLSCIANYSNIPEALVVYSFFNEDLIFYDSKQNNWLNYSIELLQDNISIKKDFIKLCNALGIELIDIIPKIEKDNILETHPFLAKFSSINLQKINTKLIYKESQTDLINEESAGIKKLFEILGPILDILSTGKVLLCDELENNLHEYILYQLIYLFQRRQKKQFAQLIFTTHDTNLLTIKLFRRDQIWFTELDNQRSTTLYSLSEIKNIRKTESFSKNYIAGKYGAIPILNKTLLNSFTNEL